MYNHIHPTLLSRPSLATQLMQAK